VAEAAAHATVDQAQDLGTVLASNRLEVVGTVGSGATPSAEVDWYRFSLTQASSVTVTAPDRSVAGSLAGVVGLYGKDPFAFDDPYNLLGYRLLAQDSSSLLHDARIDRQLAPGTYYVAVSGGGNAFFNPLIPNSGYPGSTGPYGLLVTAVALPLQSGDGPLVLASSPGSGATLDRSPLVLRVDTSTPLDPSTVLLGQSVRLTYSPSPSFGDGNDQDVSLAGSTVSTTASELRLVPGAPLQPGYYRLFLAGDSTGGGSVLEDSTGTPLGANAAHPNGQDATITFHVACVEGNQSASAGADDTPAGAHDLGDVTQAGLVQVAGTIGDDPTDPTPYNPADVDLYHFHVTGPGHFALTAEVFAGRIGSRLDPASSLFGLGTDGWLHFVASNTDTLNPTETSDGNFSPLYTDSVLYAGLTAGDYYLAVSSGSNVPNPDLGDAPGTNGVFDPWQSHSGQRGNSTGPYVLNLAVRADSAIPTVVATSLPIGATLTAPQTGFTVHFSEPMNLLPLAFRVYQQNQQANLNPIFIIGTDGTRYFPRFLGLDPATGDANFQLLDALPNGSYALHLSGALGLGDLAGNPLAGNDPSGDYVVPFIVQAAPRGTDGNPLVWTFQLTPDDIMHLGPLFPHELQAGVSLVYTAADAVENAGWNTDYYHFEVLQDQTYTFSLTGPDLPATASLRLIDAAGNPVPVALQADGRSLLAQLRAGKYGIGVEGMSSATSSGAYTLHFALVGAADTNVLLTSGPAPAISFRLASATSPPPVTPPGPPQVTLPGSAGNPSTGQATGSLAADLVPAVLTGGDSSGLLRHLTMSAPAASTAPSALSSGVLLTLSAGPVGGIRDTTTIPEPVAAPDRVLVRGPESSGVEAVVRLTVLTQSSGFEGTGEGDPVSLLPRALAAPSALISTSVRTLSTGVREALDALFGMGAWIGTLPGGPEQPGSAEAAGAMEEEPLDLVPEVRRPGSGPELSEGAASALVLVGALAAGARERGSRAAQRQGGFSWVVGSKVRGR
jgi:hypothetical protein